MKQKPIQQDSFEEPAAPVEKKRRWRLVAVLAAILGTALVLYLCGYPSRWILAATPSPSPQPTSEIPAATADFSGLAVWFLDVGQGDCAFLRSVGGKTMLIDAGPSGSFPAIRRFLDAQGVRKLDAVVCSHLHEDHIGGMAEVLDHYEVGALYLPPFDTESSAYANLVASIQRNGVTATPLYASATSLIHWDEATEVRVLSPYEVSYEDENDTSLILRVQYGSTAALFMGDAGILAEKLAIKALPNHYFHANVLKVGHHGSVDSTSKKLLETAKPEIAVISVGRDNSYGLPDPGVVNRLKDFGLSVYRTDMDKTVLVALDGTRAWVVK